MGHGATGDDGVGGVEAEAAALVESVLKAFWDLATEGGDQEDRVWPYDRVALERSIEDWLEANLDAFLAFGLAVRVAEPGPEVTGRQWRSRTGSSRLDLLLEVTQDGSTLSDGDGDGDGDDGDVELEFFAGDLVVVELKVVPLDGKSVHQIRRYMRTVQEEIAGDRRILGLLIGAGADVSLYNGLDADGDPIMTLWLSQIGYTRQFLGDLSARP